MRLTDLVAREKKFQADTATIKLDAERDAILKTLRRGLTEEEYLALALELKPSVEGYSFRVGNWSYVLYRRSDVTLIGWATVTRVKRDHKWPYNDDKTIESGRELVRWLAEVGE